VAEGGVAIWRSDRVIAMSKGPSSEGRPVDSHTAMPQHSRDTGPVKLRGGDHAERDLALAGGDLGVEDAARPLPLNDVSDVLSNEFIAGLYIDDEIYLCRSNIN
jgi:hypothetical protein